MKQTARNFISFALASTLIVGCGGIKQVRTHSGVAPLPAQNLAEVQRLLAEAEAAPSPQKEALKISAANLLLQTNTTDSSREAANIVNGLSPQGLPLNSQAEYALVKAQLALSNNNTGKAFEWVDSPNVINATNPKLTKQSYQVRAQAYERNKEYRAALDEWLLALPLLNSDEKRIAHKAIWRNLLNLDSNTLSHLASQTGDQETQGWVSLAAIVKKPEDIDQQIQAFQQWQQQWPNHPANQQIPEAMRTLEQIAAHRPNKIALLLPMTGSLGYAGKAIRDGFLAAYYHALQNGHVVPEIKVINTSKHSSIDQAITEATAQGAEMIVGPLKKSRVKQLQQLSPTIPTLTLNYGDREANSPANFYQFGLAAEDEAKQAAQQAWHDGFRAPVIIAPKSNWGNRVVTAFVNEWQSLGGSIRGEARFGGSSDYNGVIGALLSPRASTLRAHEVEQVIGKQIRHNPNRRGDVDMVFLAANAKQGRQVKPTLAYHYGGDLPVYATGTIFTGNPNPTKDSDLDGIMFPSMPWLSDHFDDPLKSKIIDTWDRSNTLYGPLFALGIDAYRLYPRLPQLKTAEGTRLFGASGSLTLNSYQQVERTQPWFFFKGGKPQPMPVNAYQQENNAPAVHYGLGQE
ncbi:penicillin-binding protein activator [Endozoicomonas sp. SM1973]|uniref:Penicillin-binding protein activator n=1 Tax=Spartinivicinus marinus TaxID=2994442 RepID=A0A853HZ42_9GAMM|nr:penicillin-binding protein activator [Spartinivicinus marinus]MCX4028304.1 penicillin-binding protein activator [Spartinivicinus marinus]NYZ65639.1 penicillin-binding protein activator [Spartinivicinus marinus]